MKFNMIVDHGMPLIALLCDYSMNCQVITSRHFIPLLQISLFYLFTNMVYSVAGYPPYPNMDWKSFEGIILPVSMCLTTIGVFKALEYLNYKKLMSTNRKNSVIL